MKFSYTFSQKHNTDRLYSHGHHLAPGGNMRLHPDDLLAPFGERLLGQVCYRSSHATIRLGQTVGQLRIWSDLQIDACKNIFTSSVLSHKCFKCFKCLLIKYLLQVMEVTNTKEHKRTQKKRKVVTCLLFSANTPSTLWTSFVIHIVNFQLHT